MWKPTKQIGVGDVHISPLAKKYINQILQTARITSGTFIASFEREFAKAHGIKYAIFCNSGTSALQVSLAVLKHVNNWHDGDEIIVPALTFVATVNVVLQNNLKPVFVDVEPDYFMMDPDKIEKKITKKTRAIIPVHIGGQPADMHKITKLARKYNLHIIEDSCETTFARYHNKPVGSFGDFSCFSTYAAHTLVTGVGGVICTNNLELALKAKSLINHGRDGIYLTMDDDHGKKPKELQHIVDHRFRFVDIGYSFRMTEFEGALGLAQMHDWKKLIAKRQQHAQYLSSGLSDLSEFLQLPTIRPQTEHVFMFYPLILKNPTISRNELVHFLEKNLIETRYLLPLLDQPIYQNLFGNNMSNKYPVAQFLTQQGFYIGCHPGLTKQELNYIIAKFHEFFRASLKSA